MHPLHESWRLLHTERRHCHSQTQVEIMMALEEKFDLQMDEEGESAYEDKLRF